MNVRLLAANAWKTIFIVLIVSCVCVTTISSQETKTDDSQLVVKSTSQKPPVGSLKDVGWIAGHWRGDAMGGKFEETWNPPLGDSMAGVFKLVKGNDVVFYELLTIVPVGNSLLVRLKHFSGSWSVGKKKTNLLSFRWWKFRRMKPGSTDSFSGASARTKCILS